MKKIALLILFLNSFFAFSQEGERISIGWNQNREYSFGTYSLNIPQFNKENLFINDYTKELSFVLKKMKMDCEHSQPEQFLQFLHLQWLNHY